MASKTTKLPFDILLSKEQQTFLKEQKQLLKAVLSAPVNEDDWDNDLKIHLIIEALFQLPIAEQNLYIIRLYGNYPTVTALANELNITKQTICKHIRESKIYIQNYVNANYRPIPY